MDSSPIRVLVIDADDQNLQQTCRLLKETCDLNVDLQCVTIHEGIEAIRAGAADVLIRGRLDAAQTLHITHEALKARVDELTRTNELLAEADRHKDEFLAMLAHELRNPLAALAAAAELVSVPDADPSSRERIVGVMERQVRHLAHLVDELLDVARLMRDKFQLHKQPVDLKTVVKQAIEASQPLLNARKHRLHVNLPALPLPMEADATRLAQAFANLLHNAAKFTRDGGDVWVSAEPAPSDREAADKVADEDEPTGPLVLVRIRDNGNGIAEDLLPRVFDLFVQGGSSPDRSAAGLGVGLTLVRRLVRLHGGSVEAHSDGPGRGSEFVVRLPLAGPVAPAPAAAAGDWAQSIPLHRLLLVDDNVDTAETMAKLLRHLGQEVRTAHDGLTALTAALSFHPQIVLLDIGLPGISGYEVARRLRQQAGMEKALLVALTGYSREDDGDRCKEAGFDYHLLKPVRLKTLETLLVDPARLSEDSRFR